MRDPTPSFLCMTMYYARHFSFQKPLPVLGYHLESTSRHSFISQVHTIIPLPTCCVLSHPIVTLFLTHPLSSFAVGSFLILG